MNIKITPNCPLLIWLFMLTKKERTKTKENLLQKEKEEHLEKLDTAINCRRNPKKPRRTMMIRRWT